MTEPPADQNAQPASTDASSDRVAYPTNHVVGILNSPEQVTSALTALTGGGFLDSEIGISCGPAAAEALDKSTGRTGLANLAIRIAERLGIANDEMMMKEQYEQALLEGRFVVSVPATSDERKVRAGQVLKDHGGYFVNFLGRYTVQSLDR